MSRPESAHKSQSMLSVFAWADRRHDFLLETYEQLLVSPDRKHISRCLYLAHQIQSATKTNSDGVLAALQLNRSARYKHVKELFVAVLCEQMGKEFGMTPSARLLLMCAAMTQDIGMLELQMETLDRQRTELTDAQRKLIRKHPLLGCRILMKAGVRDALWLETVSQHHERFNGTGYPLGLHDDQISQGAQILAVADIYVAMMRPRGDREAMLPKDAQREIFMSRNITLDPDMARALRDCLGIFPPGTWVRLANGEVGVVTRICKDKPFPEVAVIISSQGDHLEQGELRDTSQKRMAIVEMTSAPFHFNLSAILASLWPGLIEGRGR